MSIFDKNETLRVQDYIATLRRKWVVMVVAFAFCLLGAGYVTWTTPPLYQATTTLMINPDMAQAILGSMNPYAAELNAQLSVATELQVVDSYPIMANAVKRLNLATEEDPEHFANAVQGLRGSILTEALPKTRLFKITARSNDPQNAANMANTVAEVFIDESMRARFDASKKTVSWLTDQILEMGKNMEDAERALIDYQREENLSAQGLQSDLEIQKLSGIREQYIQNQSRESELRTRMEQVKKLSSDPDIHFVPGDLSESLGRLSGDLTALELDLKKAELEYKGKHPKIVRIRDEIEVVQKQIQSELKGVLRSLESEFQTNLARGRVLREALMSLNERELLGSEKQVRLTILKRDIDTYKELYNILVKKLKAADLTRGIGESNFRVVEEARVPRSPLSPNKTKNLLAGFGVGIVFAILAAFVAEYFDHRIYSPEDLRRSVDWPIVGTVPHVEGLIENRQGIVLSQERQHSPEAVAFQALRTNLRLGQQNGVSQVYLVTSTSPGEGKTTIAVNLALSLAFAGYRTLLVDTDLRKPRLHQIFEVSNERGVGNAHESPLESLIQKTPYANLEIISSGPHIRTPFEYLESPAMQDFIEAAKKRYDQIIFDSPPVGSVVDATILATYADNVLCVVRSGRVESLHLQHACEQLQKTKAKHQGFVLNSLDYSTSKYYYSSYYYRGYYGNPPSSPSRQDESTIESS